MDEWQSPKTDAEKGHHLHPDNPYGLIGSIQGMIDAKALNPELFIMVYWRSESSIRPALEHDAVDLLTVHAIDEDWNRAALQIPIRLIRKN